MVHCSQQVTLWSVLRIGGLFRCMCFCSQCRGVRVCVLGITNFFSFLSFKPLGKKKKIPIRMYKSESLPLEQFLLIRVHKLVEPQNSANSESRRVGSFSQERILCVGVHGERTRAALSGFTLKCSYGTYNSTLGIWQDWGQYYRQHSRLYHLLDKIPDQLS